MKVMRGRKKKRKKKGWRSIKRCSSHIDEFLDSKVIHCKMSMMALQIVLQCMSYCTFYDVQGHLVSFPKSLLT